MTAPDIVTGESDAEPIAAPTRRQRGGRWVVVLNFLFLIVVAGVLLIIRCHADESNLATLLAYGPRWPWLAPAGVLLLLSCFYRRGWTVAGLSLILVAWPIMQFNIPWRGFGTKAPNGPPLRIMTFNTGDGSGFSFDRARLRELVEKEKIDVVILEESHHRDIAQEWPGDWRLVLDYDLTIISQFALSDRKLFTPEAVGGAAAGVSYKVQTPQGAFRLFAFHLETPRPGFEALMHRKSTALGTLARISQRRTAQFQFVGDQIRTQDGPLILTGDFNTVADSPLISRNIAQLRNAFSEAGLGYGNTKFTGYWGARIDHVFHTDAWRATRCWVGPDLGSDHRPVIAELQWKRD